MFQKNGSTLLEWGDNNQIVDYCVFVWMHVVQLWCIRPLQKNSLFSIPAAREFPHGFVHHFII